MSGATCGRERQRLLGGRRLGDDTMPSPAMALATAERTSGWSSTIITVTIGRGAVIPAAPRRLAWAVRSTAVAPTGRTGRPCPVRAARRSGADRR